MPRHISTTALSKKLGISSRELFAEFEKLDWITSNRNLTVEGFSVGAIYKEIVKDGETIKYIAWPENIQLGVSPQEKQFVTASGLANTFGISSLKMNFMLSEIGWTKRGELNKGWVVTQIGVNLGAIQSEDTKTGIPYVRWPESITNNPALINTIADFKGVTYKAKHPDVLSFRERFATKYRTTDGHMVRSQAEALISNWLYLFEIAHAYERKLPIEEEVYSCFYIPHGKVYIEYFGCETDESYGYDKNCQTRKQERLEIYQRYGFNLIVIEDAEIESLDEVLSRRLLKFGVQTY